ncbi:hypothetical protein ACFL0W_05005 [Nanoarchaeota archaeon]
MMILSATIKEIKVEDFTPKDGIQFTVSYNDGVDDKSFVTEKAHLNKSDEILESIIKQIRKNCKTTNLNFDGQNLYKDSTIVKITKEGEVEDLMLKFFNDIADNISNLLITREADKYIQGLVVIKGMKLEF